MQIPKGVQIELDIDELTTRFNNYLLPLFNEWKRVVPEQIQSKIIHPLFTINGDMTISLNFPKEVIIYQFL